MADTLSCKRLVLRAVLHQVSPIVIRLISVSDQLQLPALQESIPFGGRQVFAMTVMVVESIHAADSSSFQFVNVLVLRLIPNRFPIWFRKEWQVNDLGKSACICAH